MASGYFWFSNFDTICRYDSTAYLQKSIDPEEILDWIARLFGEKRPARPIRKREEDVFIKDAMRYVMINHSKPITATSVANYFGVDRTALNNLFKEATGMRLKRYLYI